MPREAKLAVLRAKTDHNLVTLIQRETERALALANVAASKGSPLYAQAEKAYETVKSLLPKIAALSRDERIAMEVKLKELETALDRLPAETVQWHTA